MSHKMEEQPFSNLKISSSDFLDTLQGRSKCPKCKRSRKYYCYTCYVPVDQLQGKIPCVQIPIKIDIIKHPSEVDGKSTAAHAKILAPDDVTVYTYPCIPDYPRDGSVVLVFPGNDSLTLEELANQKDIKLKSCQYEDKGNVLCKESHMESEDPNSDDSKPVSHTAQVFNKTLEEHHDSDNHWQISDSISGEVTPAFSTETQPGELQTSGSCIIKRKFENNEEAISSVDKAVFKRAVFIDSTWNQTNRISTDERLKGLPYIMLKDRESKFWRHQRENPPSYLSTIEAIYYLLCDYHDFFISVNYNGDYDNLMFFFSFMYNKIHGLYIGRTLRADSQRKKVKK
ncbi:tRNA-uridine aminocarboxypropyltransferase 1-like isoform X2 [Mytilus californianus]|uniref:tRNA-uridine aminocarboxypropyltransferase 1-like isoform X2 n=1 Tax=Mytilus californianus TaxID=6549 RepID=UPI002247B13D|nr:tRNA-uridine aminocarboxypropyltransferase 1-like isoform X2 [Mytilus californianus]